MKKLIHLFYVPNPNYTVILSQSEESAKYEDFPGFCKSATLEEVKAQAYKLTPGIYVGTEDEDDEGIPFEEKLKSKLREQFEKSIELQKTITDNLNSF